MIHKFINLFAMKNSIDQRITELEKIELARKKHEQIQTTAARIDSKTVILVKVGKDKVKAVETFKKKHGEYLEYEKTHAEPFLSK